MLQNPSQIIQLLKEKKYTWNFLFGSGSELSPNKLISLLTNQSQNAITNAISKKKSLCYLSNRFIKLFYDWKLVISLEEAATYFMQDSAKITSSLHDSKNFALKSLINEQQTNRAELQSQYVMKSDQYENNRKTKIRRLYDIANILQALKLIVKTTDSQGKPAFQWVGVKGLLNFTQELTKNLARADNSEIKGAKIQTHERFERNQQQKGDPNIEDEEENKSEEEISYDSKNVESEQTDMKI